MADETIFRHYCRARVRKRVIIYLIGIVTAFLLVHSVTHNSNTSDYGQAPAKVVDETLVLESSLIDESGNKPLVCVLVLACDRPSVARCLDSLFRSRNLTTSVNFPVIVSQDCGKHPETTRIIDSYGDQLLHIYQPDQREIVPSNPNIKVGFYKQTRHYKWALTRAFTHYQCPHVITLEDDLEVSPDFFEYFAGLLPVYERDPSLFCVTASNYQARPKTVDLKATDLLYRSDFFFGWGWLMSRKIFASIVPQWPEVFWDTWMGTLDVINGRACIRPEIPRVLNFGREGTSGIQFYEKQVKDLVYNKEFVPFTRMDLRYLFKYKYDRDLKAKVARSQEVKNMWDLEEGDLPGPPNSSLKIFYTSQMEFHNIGTFFNLDTKTWNGIAHTEYRGILTCMWKGRRVYIVPKDDYKYYDPEYDYDTEGHL